MSNKLYTSIPAPKVPRNVFNLSRYNSLTMPYQRVCPAALQEIVPGDNFRWSAEVFARLQPMVAPVMTDQKISVHAFFVPLRTVNKHFAEFMFNNKNGNYTGVLPYLTLGRLYRFISNLNTVSGVEKDLLVDAIRLFDYIGLPFSYRSATANTTFVSQWLSDNSALQNSELRVNLAPFFAYTKIWSEYFRDENLIDDPFETWTGYGYADVMDWTGNKDSFFTIAQINERFVRCFLVLRPRAWQHDRFTSSLPFAQRGPDVLLPVSGTFQVTQDGPGLDGTVVWDGDAAEGGLMVQTQPGDEPLDLFGSIDGISTTINDFRRAERLQRWYENSARGGVRPNEATLAHFGVRTPDATLDRAEFLGGSMQPIVVSEVAQTSETTQTGTPQGTLAGKGTSYKSAGLFKHFFTEHGFVFVFASALIRPAYWQGIPRVFSRMQRDEYYWPEFALLGEEPVFDKELFVDGSTTEDGVFGYVPRYADYKSALPEVHGDFRTSLDYWVNPRKFANQPALNGEFIFGNPQKKMFAVTSDYTDSLLVTIRHDVKASRLMPFYGVPTI